MIEATISRVRMRDLARPGRYCRKQASKRPCVGRALRDGERTEASSIATALPSRPGAARSRPGDGESCPRTSRLRRRARTPAQA